MPRDDVKKPESGGLQALVLQQLSHISTKLDEQAGGLQACLSQQAALKASVDLSLNDGKHVMARHEEKIVALERWRDACTKCNRSDESTWGGKREHRPHRYDPPTSDAITKKDRTASLDAATLAKLIKAGLWAGAVVAGALMGWMSK